MKLRYKVFFPLLLFGALLEAYLVLAWLPATLEEERSHYLQKIDEHLNSLTSALLVPVLDKDFAALYGILDKVRNDNPFWRQLSLFDENGVRLYPLHEQPVESTASGAMQRLTKGVDYLGEEIGQLVLGVDINAELAAANSRFRQVTWIMLAAIAVIMLAALIVVEINVRRPVAKLAKAANSLRSGDFSAPLPNPSGDEIGGLVASFGAMRDAIQNYQQELKQQIAERRRAENIQRGRSQVLEQIAAGAALEDVLDLLAMSIEATNPEMLCSILLLDADGEHFRHGAAPSLPEAYNQALAGAKIGLGAGSCGTAAFTGETVIVEDIASHPYWASYQELAKLAGVRASWSTPIVSAGGQVLGTFALYYSTPRKPDQRDLDFIATGAQLAAIAIEHKRTEGALTYQASHDALTGLVNRREFEKRLQQALESSRNDNSQHALCYLDLDQFKVINDTCGHVAGDELLRQVAGLLREHVRKQDSVARLGGDEFGILMESCPIDQAKRIANVLRHAIEDYRFLWEDKSFSIGVSIGLVPITGASEGVDGILRAADTACYTAKDQGRNRVHLYHEEDTELAKRHKEMQWVARLQQAMEDNRLFFQFQPIAPVISNGDSRLHFEILLRMEDEGAQMISPNAFLPAAERYNLSTKLDRWVISTVFQWLQNHPDHLADLLLCSINLSGLSVGDDGFLEFIDQSFAKTGIPPEKICFELTETAAIANLSSATRFIKALKKLGCWFALDDFGSGLSSFAYLKNLPVDLLKIDGVFVKDILNDPIDLAMVRAINEIGHVMGKQTVAEFVESEQVLNKLREIGVDFVQGYHIGRPQSIERFMRRKTVA